jgi:hypothetical protein
LRRKAEEIFFSHNIFKYIFAARISLKQIPFNPNSFFLCALPPLAFPPACATFQPESGPSPVALRQ